MEQNKRMTHLVEETKSQVLRQSTFRDMVLLERYNMIKDLNNRMEVVRINYERMKKGQPTRIEIVNGETVMLTDIYAALQLNRAILMEDFYDLLSQRYKLVS